MKRTSSGTGPKSPSPTLSPNADRCSHEPPTRETRVRIECMHYPGRPSLAVLVVGAGEHDAVSQQLDVWQRRAREVECNYCVIEAGDASEDVTRCADVLQQHVPGDATVVLLQSADQVGPDDIERAQSALGFAGLVRRSRGPFLAGDGTTDRLPIFPSEASLARRALVEGSETPSGETIDGHAEAAFEARQHVLRNLQREQRLGQVIAMEKQVDGLTFEVLSLASKVLGLLPTPGPETVLDSGLQKLLNKLQFKSHWRARASTPQATRWMDLLLRVGTPAASAPGSPAEAALREILRAMACGAPESDAVLAAVDRWPAEGSDQARLAVLLRALREHEVASGMCDRNPVEAPRWLARCVVLHDRLGTMAASVFGTLGEAGVRNPRYEARLRDYVEQGQLALLLGLEDALPDGDELSTPGFDPVAGVLFAALLQVRQRIDQELDGFMAQWAPWQTMLERLTSQGRWPPEAASTDSD